MSSTAYQIQQKNLIPGKLVNLVVSRQRHQTSSKVRLTRLLLTLLPVSAVDKLSLETLFFQRTLGAVAVDKLVMDLLQVKLSQNSENVF